MKENAIFHQVKSLCVNDVLVNKNVFNIVLTKIAGC